MSFTLRPCALAARANVRTQRVAATLHAQHRSLQLGCAAWVSGSRSILDVVLCSHRPVAGAGSNQLDRPQVNVVKVLLLVDQELLFAFCR